LAGQTPLAATLNAALTGVLVCVGTQVLRTFPLQPYPRMRADHYAWFIGVALLLAIARGASDAWSAGAPFYLSDWTLHAAAHFAGTLLVV
ncbi:hypothetical protein NK918_24285, partial [Salmonella enterica subsp. enterica serovar Typhimurium]|nr:hypothetical protein [Salmonella enterica subsp. enterica serovar Typhimurium]